MKKQSLVKIFALGIVILFFGTYFVSSISGDNSSNKNTIQINKSTFLQSTDWWSMYHHDLNLTGYTTSTAPTTNKVLWAAEAGEDYWYDPQRSSPAIVNDTIYIAGVDPSYPKSTSTSNEIELQKNRLPLKNFFHFDRNQNENPILERWYEAYLVCLNATTGYEKWKTRLDDEYFVRGSPAVSDNRVYVTTANSWSSAFGYLFCLDASTGSILWNFTLNGYEAYSPSVENGKVYVSGWVLGENSSKICKLFCLDGETGVEVFNTTLGFGESVDAAAIYNNRIYISGCDWDTHETFLYCVDILNGTIYWTKNLPGNYWVSSPVTYNGKLFVISSSFDFLENYSCYIECFDAITGGTQWNRYIEGVANAWSTPAIAYDNIYFTAFNMSPDPYGEIYEEGWFYCLNLTTGDILWFKLLTEESTFASSPAIADGRIYINSMGFWNIHGNMFCLDAFTGDVIWQYWLVSPIYSSPAIASGRLHLVCWDYFYTFDDSASYDNPPIVTITGPHYGLPGNEYNYTILIEDPEGHSVRVIFEWSREWPGCYTSWERPSGVPEVLPLPFDEEGEYWMRIRSQDTMNYTWSNWTVFIVNISENNRPSTPIISGHINGKIKRTYDYTFVSTNPNEDDLRYFIDWGDGTNSSWIGPYASAEQVTQSHAWSKKGTYSIKAKAKDTFSTESDWATFEVNIKLSRNRVSDSSLFMRFLKQFQDIFPILKYVFSGS